MKLKPSEILLLICALFVGIAAYFFQGLESRVEKHTTVETESPTTEIFADQQTISDTTTVLHLDTDQARTNLTQFYLHFQQLFDPDTQTESLAAIKSLLSSELLDQIDTYAIPEQPTEISKIVGIVIQPQEVIISKIEQTTPDSLLATVLITLPNNATLSEQVTLIPEAQNWKIHKFSNAAE